MNNDQTTKRLLDSKALSAYLGVSESTICRMRQSGSGPAYIMVLGLPRYRRETIDAWIELQEQREGIA